jgi:peptidoglycan/LPS O-acetylase OafA/YrhL
MNVRAERFPLMDSLRAIAAMSVLAFHAAFFSGLYDSNSVLRPYLEQPSAGVTVFFVISGFLLYRPFVQARLAGGLQPSTGAYAWRRFLRIVPAYWVALTVIGIWLSIGDIVDPGWHIPLYYGFGQIYTARTAIGGIGQAWTLCVEITFYAFLPLWALAMRRFNVRRELVALAALWLTSLAWKVFAIRRVSPTALDAGPWLMPLPNFLDHFALGMALAVISTREPSRALQRATRRAWPWWLLAAAAYWVLSNQLDLRDHNGRSWFIARHEVETLVALGLVVPAVFAWERRDAVRRLLGWRPLLYVGLVSYGIYLWHYAFVVKIAHGIAHWMTDNGLGVNARLALLFVLSLAGSIAIASVGYYLIERPALSLKRLVRR